MRITLAQLDAFFWVARLGTVREAAQQLNLAQPTVSLRIRDLERSLGIKLFHRVGRGLRLSHDGDVLLSYAHTIQNEIGRINERIGKVGDVSGVLRVGVPETFALVCLPSLLRLLRAQYPALRLDLLVATSFELERMVGEQRLDLAFTVNPSSDPRLRLIPLGIQETTWAASHEWGLSATVRPADLRHIPIITNPHPSAMFRQIIDWFRTAGLEPSRLDICNSLTVIAHLVENGVAVGFLPRKIIEAQVAAGKIDALASRPLVGQARVYAAYRTADASGSIDAVVRSAQQILASIDFLLPP